MKLEHTEKIANIIVYEGSQLSVMEELALLSRENPLEYKKIIDELVETKGEDWIRNLRYDWSVNARPKQMIPEPREDWRVWCLLSGRGFGKSRCGAETVRTYVKNGWAKDIALIGRTTADVTTVMVDGPSGLLRCYPEDEYPKPHWQPTNRKISWRDREGKEVAVAHTYSAEEPERLRGPQHDFGWCLAGDTPVLMSDYTEKALQDIQIGDYVQTRVGARAVTGKVLTKENSEVYQLLLMDGRAIVGTGEHLVFIKDKGFIQIKNLKQGDLVVCAKPVSNSTKEFITSEETAGIIKPPERFLSQDALMQNFVQSNAPNLVAIEAVDVRKLQKKCDVYDISVSGAREFFANGALVHNCDELGAWRYPMTWKMFQLGLRLGDNPQAIITTTPRQFPILLEILARKTTVTTRGTTYENRSNLAPGFFDDIVTEFEGTRLGRQELEAEIIESVPDAMWREETIEKYRITDVKDVPDLLMTVLAIDPATTTRTTSAETGMAVVAYGSDDEYYVLHMDGHREQPEAWARRAKFLYDEYMCDKIIAEVNNGGDLVVRNIQIEAPDIKVVQVHASRGKAVRAEPIANLYEKGKVHHVGYFKKGELQMVSFNPVENPYGLKDACLTGDTMIETIEGSKEIKNVEFGDYVLTRSGYRRVVASYMTNDAAKVYTVKLSNGKTITATPNHPIFIKDKGFVDVDSLVCGDILLSIEENNIWQNEKKLNSTETCTTDILKLKSRITENITGAHIKEDLSIYIEIFMSIIMVGFPKAITYITKMMTIIIIPMIISRLSRRKSITKDIERRIVEGLVRQSISHNSNLSESLLKHGIKQSTGRSGTGEMVLNLIKNENLLNEYVMSVVRAMVQWAGERPTGIAQNFVETDSLKNPRNITLPQNALSAEVSSFNINIEQNTGEKHVPVSVVGIYDEKKISPVYNITVEDDHEYYANGVLTHNCEAMVWGLTYLVSVTRNNRYSPPLVGNTRDKLTQYNRIFRI